MDEEGVERPVCFASRSLHKSEVKYSVLEKEALTIVWMLERQGVTRVYLDILANG